MAKHFREATGELRGRRHQTTATTQSSAIQKGGNAAMYYERCEICGNRWQRIPLAMAARDSKTTLSNRTVRSRQQGSDRSRSNALFVHTDTEA